ncbi:MAG: hypothetical protein QOJ17_1050 [Rhodospirillaceae bacterium]|nr:hypothetical protein [Rhodospirillaceae bacterium]
MTGFGAGTGMPSSKAFHLSDPRAVRSDLVSIKRTDLAFGLSVVFPGERPGIVDVSASNIAEHLRVQ